MKASGGKGGHFFSALTEKITCCGYFLKIFHKILRKIQMQFAKMSDKMKLSEGKFGQVKGKIVLRKEV